MTKRNRPRKAPAPAGSCQPSAQPAHLRRQHHAAGQQEQGQTAARSSPRPYSSRAEEQERAGTTEQERSRPAAASATTAPPGPHHHRPPAPASRPTTPSRRPCSRSNPTQPQRPERSRERVQRRGGGERGGAARLSVQISRPGHNMPNTPPAAQGRPSRSDPATSATREQPEPPAVLRCSSAFGENAEPATPQPPKSDGRQPHPAAVAPPDRGSLDISATPAHLR